MEEIENIVSPIETVLNRALSNIYINTSLKVFLGLYAAFAAPKLPSTVVNLMDNTIMRIFVGFIIVLLATKDPALALMVSIAFIITLQTANKYRLINTSLSVSGPGESSWLPSVTNNEVKSNNINLGLNTKVGPPNPLPKLLKKKIDKLESFTEAGGSAAEQNAKSPRQLAEENMPLGPLLAAKDDNVGTDNFDYLVKNVSANVNRISLLEKQINDHKDIPHLVIPGDQISESKTIRAENTTLGNTPPTQNEFTSTASSPQGQEATSNELFKNYQKSELESALEDAMNEINNFSPPAVSEEEESEPELILDTSVNHESNLEYEEDVSEKVESNKYTVTEDNTDKNNDGVADSNKLSAYMYSDISQHEIDTMNLSMPSLNLKQPVKNFSEVGDLKNDPFTSTYQFLDAQSNLVTGSDSFSSQNTFDNQYCTQGNDSL